MNIITEEIIILNEIVLYVISILYLYFQLVKKYRMFEEFCNYQFQEQRQIIFICILSLTPLLNIFLASTILVLNSTIKIFKYK